MYTTIYAEYFCAQCNAKRSIMNAHDGSQFELVLKIFKFTVRSLSLEISLS